MVMVCDKCRKKSLLYDTKIKNKKFQLCIDCSNLLIDVINENEEPRGFKKFLNNFDVGYGK